MHQIKPSPFTPEVRERLESIARGVSGPDGIHFDAADEISESDLALMRSETIRIDGPDARYDEMSDRAYYVAGIYLGALRREARIAKVQADIAAREHADEAERVERERADEAERGRAESEWFHDIMAEAEIAEGIIVQAEVTRLYDEGYSGDEIHRRVALMRAERRRRRTN